MARFAYYNRLSRANKEIYRCSDAIETVHIPQPQVLLPALRQLAAALKAADRAQTQAACSAITGELTRQLGTPPVTVKVLANRPQNDWEELHGLYEPETARISVWMRTAQRKQIVAFKTFLRTLLHELCHHLDYTCFKLADSYHTEGFYKRESDIYKRLLEVVTQAAE
jgi:hypothetical protein